MNLKKILPLNSRRMDVLLEIYLEGQDYLRNISKKLKMNPSLTFKILNKLCEGKFLIKRKVGKEVFYSFDKNKDYEIILGFLEEYYLERIVSKSEMLQKTVNLLRSNQELINSSYKIYLFVPYTGEKPGEKSSIDILFVNEDKSSVEKACSNISSIVGKDIIPLIYTKETFYSELLRKGPLLESVVNQIKNRVVIK